MWLRNGLDFKLDALFLAGEPQDGTSEYDSRVFEWLTVVQRAVVSGGPLGQAYLRPAEWYWARAWPRGAIQLVQPFNVDQAVTATFTTGSNFVPLSPGLAVGLDLAGFRVQQDAVAARHIIERNVAASLTLREPWTGETMTTAVWLAYPDTYELPGDFVRGMSPLFLFAFPQVYPTSPTIDLVDPVDLERLYPQSFPWSAATTGSPNTLPIVAAKVSERRIRFSHYLHTPQTPLPIQIEFEYIRRPPFITEGAIPAIPLEHRRILSYGCAALILDDKDDSGAASLYQKVEGQYQAMLDEHVRDARRMSSSWGRIQPSRLTGYRGPSMLTESGLPVYVW